MIAFLKEVLSKTVASIMGTLLAKKLVLTNSQKEGLQYLEEIEETVTLIKETRKTVKRIRKSKGGSGSKDKSRSA